MTWFEVMNKATDRTEIRLYDQIGGFGIDASQFVSVLNEVKSEQLDVHISSPGGEVFQGFTIYKALLDFPGTVNIFVDGIAASIASVIAMAGDKVTIAKNAEMMIHEGYITMTGNVADISAAMERLDRVSNNIASVYAERSGMGSPEDWRAAMKAETWYSAEEAVRAGLADEIAAPAKRAARNKEDFKVFNYAGRDESPAPKLFGVDESAAPTETQIHIDVDSIDNIIRKVWEN